MNRQRVITTQALRLSCVGRGSAPHHCVPRNGATAIGKKHSGILPLPWPWRVRTSQLYALLNRMDEEVNPTRCHGSSWRHLVSITGVLVRRPWSSNLGAGSRVRPCLSGRQGGGRGRTCLCHLGLTHRRLSQLMVRVFKSCHNVFSAFRCSLCFGV